ncbi:MDR family MFS transporter [Microbispora sp. NBRC 16548]|uniref:MDR family MFS transporter n=1 Tax=Microbispora sp. NBRC 16548 TaxID=3030994 RepID=UPI0024A467FD|nr:MDR family MFS transporter [Microbispora sp. NBRC 16548]GLX04265.1 MFS transporter [Microbispora sp. NBRC 16548]
MSTLRPSLARERLDPGFVRLSLVMLTGALAVVFDTTIVNIALETLGRQLRVPVSTVQWITTGYLLALGMAVPTTNWLTGRFGGKKVWLAALALFLAGSVGASLAPDATTLIVCRVVQGAGGGLMLPVMQTLLVQAANGRSLGRATAVIALPALLGPVLGPVLGGLIVQHLTWRWIFWVNVPFCLAGLALAWRFMPSGERDRDAALDWIGLALLCPGIAAIIFGLSRVSADRGFGHAEVLLPLVAGATLVACFAVRALRTDGTPLVDVRLLGKPSFGAASALMFLSGFVLYGAMLLIPLYFQQVGGLDALTAGLLLAPQGIGVLLSRGPAGTLTDRVGARPVTAVGLAVTALGTLPFAWAGPGIETWWLIAALVVRGIGLGAVTIPIMTSAYEGLARDRVPHASVITRTLQQIGGSFGTAVLAVVLDSELARHPGGSPDAAAAFGHTFWWSVGFTVLALAVSAWLPSRLTRRATGR